MKVLDIDIISEPDCMVKVILNYQDQIITANKINTYLYLGRIGEYFIDSSSYFELRYKGIFLKGNHDLDLVLPTIKKLRFSIEKERNIWVNNIKILVDRINASYKFYFLKKKLNI